MRCLSNFSGCRWLYSFTLTPLPPEELPQICESWLKSYLMQVWQDTLNQRYHHPKLCYHIEKLKCKDCQEYKLAGRGYGLLPKWEVRIAPWEEVAIDLIGSWKVKVNCWQVEFNTLTCIDTALNLVKLIRVDNKAAEHICDKFTQSWLCLYPHPVQCLHDKGGEFIGQNFQWLLEILRIKDECSTSKIRNLMQSVKECIRQ